MDAITGGDSRGGADESAAGRLDDFGERELALIDRNRRRHREYIVPKYPRRSYRGGLTCAQLANQPAAYEGFTMADSKVPIVGVIMGSKSDWEYMAAAAEVMEELQVPHEVRIMSAHRTPDITLEYSASAAGRGLRVIIAGAGGAAHLAGVVAAKTILPVIGVPMPTTSLNGIDSLLSIVQMPKGVPVATMAIGKAGAANAGLMAAQIIALSDAKLGERLVKWRAARAQELLQQKIP